MAPHSIEAEEAVLGSLLIDPDAILRVASFLKAEDFYREKNGWIYQAILDLHERREPADFVTLCEELERRGQLDEIGGPAEITRLINAVPTAIHVEFYGRIVERAAIRRRLISAAGQIAALAYEEAEDVDEVVDRAEQILFGVSERRLTRDLVPIDRIIHEYYDRIEYLYQHRGEPIGVPTGFIDLDRLLGGMQRSDLLIIAGRPGMGKTAFALSVARTAAKKFNQRVAFFSLEMASEQVVQRLISAETGIDSRRLRLGELEEDEWPLFVQATGVLAELPIFIDDTPSISALQLRTKARRLHAEYGLDLVIVDYLQLMRGDFRAENRVQEISSISRALKALARELNVPVLAASQLSRAVESRQDKHPILSDLRESGCLTGDTRVYMPDTGHYVPIRELAGHTGFKVLGLNTETWKLERREVERAFATGVKKVYRLTTRLGRTVRATSNHKFLTIRGWKRLDELYIGERIALPRRLESPPTRSMSDAELALLGHLIGDGCTAIWRMYVVPAMQQRGITMRQMQAALGNAYCGTALYKQNVSRERAARVAQTVGSEELARLAASDVYWDEIVSIEPEGTEEVYDLTVPGLHNFIANDIIVHNSIEQDADVVMFIYRDELYNPNTDFPNLADITVAKHRNGPTGRVQLYFNDKLATFSDAETRIEPLEY